jgi:hypothetical protein
MQDVQHVALDDVHNHDSGHILCLSRSPAVLHPSTTLLLLLLHFQVVSL